MTISALALTGCNQKGGGYGGKNVKLKDDNSKVFYTMGNMLGGNIARLDLNESELNSLVAGLADAARKNKARVDVNKHRGKIQQLVAGRMEKAAEKQKVEGKKHLEAFLKEKGAKKTESGLAYKVLKEGTGKKPAATDKVEVHYHGTLIDGTVFDSSVERKKPAKFPLNRVIKGWTEGLQLVGVGGKLRLVIPPELGYGPRGAGKIPGGATLVFDVELLSIVDPVQEKKEMEEAMKKAKKAATAKNEAAKKAAPAKKAEKK